MFVKNISKLAAAANRGMCIHIRRQKVAGRQRFQAMVTFTRQRVDEIEQIIDNIEFGTVSKIKMGCKIGYRLQITGARAVDLLKQLHPHIPSRSNEIKAIEDFFKYGLFGINNEIYGSAKLIEDEIIQTRARLYEEFKMAKLGGSFQY